VRKAVSIKLNAVLAALALAASACAGDESESMSSPLVVSNQVVEVWVVLSEPALASLPRDAKEERAALRERILMQQNNVVAQLVALGATLSGRIQHTENAVAIRLPAAAIESVRKIDGVIDVRPVSDRNRIDSR
jgi:hypothetical protein